MILVLHTLGFLSASDNGWDIKNANFYNNMYWNSRYTNFWCKTTFCDFPCVVFKRQMSWMNLLIIYSFRKIFTISQIPAILQNY